MKLKRTDPDLMLLHRVLTPFHRTKQVRLQPSSLPTSIGKAHAQTLSEPYLIVPQTDLHSALQTSPTRQLQKKLDTEDFNFSKVTLSNYQSPTAIKAPPSCLPTNSVRSAQSEQSVPVRGAGKSGTAHWNVVRRTILRILTCAGRAWMESSRRRRVK